MVVGYVALGILVGLVGAIALGVSGFGFLTAIAAYAGIGTVSVLVAMIFGANCPAMQERSERF